ncbi:MAG TPA: response regulator transcription factor [Terracidiphilus sp.]|jgi:DNA-binding NarL/FixJ family response regulator
MKKTILICGLLGGVLIALLRWSEYQFLVIDHSVEIYAALVAAVFSGLGIWLGVKLTRPRQAAEVASVSPTPEVGRLAAPAGDGFVLDDRKRDEVGITRREMEILELVAAGLSNREIAEKLFVSENTVKTHCSRAFDKLGARRRTEAVLMGKKLGLLP